MLMARLGDILTQAGLIPADAPAQARELGLGLPEYLFSRQLLTPAELSVFLDRQFGIGYWEPDGAPLSPTLRELLPQALALKHRMVPVRTEGDTLHLAMADPLDLAAIDAAQVCQKQVRPLLGDADAIARAISQLWAPATAQAALEELRSGQEAEGAQAPIVRLVDGFLEYAVSQNASDIHLEPRAGEMAVRLRLDGRLQECFRVPKENQAPVIARIKVMADLDVAEHRIPQDGRSRITVADTTVDLRVSTMPTIWGEKAVIRLLHRPAALLTPEGIGLAGEELRKFQELLTTGSGVILLSGPTGAGKSATMYTMISRLNREDVNLITLEDPVEYHIPRVNQIPIQEKYGMSFASALRSVLRQDPDIIAIGEIRDPETARIAMGAAITGHLVLSTIHCADAAGAIDRLREMGAEDYLISAALRGVIAQRLVRKICPGCRESYHPDPDEQRALGLEPRTDRVFHRGRGCERCFSTGYRGRTGVFEILTLSPALRRAIAGGCSRSELEVLIAREGHAPMGAGCLRLVNSGITTAQEAYRVIRSTDQVTG